MTVFTVTVITYILLLSLMMIKLWQENIHIIEKTVIVS